jgi:aminopeptidase N
MGRAGSSRSGETKALTLAALLALAACNGRPRATDAAALPPTAPRAGPSAPSRAVGAGGAAAAASPDITSYSTSIELDPAAHTVWGTTTLVYSAATGSTELRLPQNGLVIDAVSSHGAAVGFGIDAGTIVIASSYGQPSAPGSSPVEPGAERQLEIRYHAAPQRGLVFGPELVYTDFFTCHWMPCREEPGDRASFRLELLVPESYRVVASGRLLESTPVAPGRTRSVWLEEQPYASYLFGFAAGKLNQATLRSGTSELRLLGVDVPAAGLEHRFAPTPSMVQFFEQKAGVPLPHGSYTQVLVPGSIAQEKSSFSLIGREELDPILSEPSEDWVIAHELAHQWWGNSITCKDWSHVWLDEGLTTFMVAAYKEQRWGAAAYERELGLFRQRHAWAAEAGFDVKLAFAGDYPSLRMQRAIVYSKAALFLHHLRQELGDVRFWSGLRYFTQQRAGQSVDSRDFQHDLETASGADLSAPFQAWVFD